MIKAKHLIAFVCIEAIIQVAYMAPCVASSCEPIEADLCKELDNNYNQTKFPTKRFISQEDALLQFDSYEALVRSNCSAKLSRFLCSYYFPPCVDISCQSTDEVELNPCQNFCTEVQRECEPVLVAYNHTWNFNCSELPESQPCIDVPNPTSEPTSNPIAPGIDMCQAINNSVCASLHPRYKTFFPTDHFSSQEAADLHFEAFEGFVDHNCSDDLKMLLCGSHYPVCLQDEQDGSEVNVLYPCKNVCRQVKRKCEPLLEENNATWPDILDCDKFPSKKDGICIDAASFEDSMPDPKCEPIDPRVQDICGALNETYNMTSFPHGKFKTQNESYEEFITYLTNFTSNCSAEWLALLCYHHFPSCSPGQEVKVPCKAVCRKARTNCEDCFKQEGLEWPDVFDCDNNYAVNKNCVSLKDIDKYTSAFVSEPCKSD